MASVLLSRSAKTALIAFVVFDLLVGAWFARLYFLRSEVTEINELREMGATRYPQARPIANFQLQNQRGENFTQQDLLNRWSLVFFGFTSCPDVCPLTMTELSEFYGDYKALGATELPQVVFITVDPERDGVNEIAEYMERFDEDFVGLAGNPQAIADVAAEFFVAYSNESSNMGHEGHPAPSSQSDDYSVSHSVHVSVVDPQGRLHSVIRPPILRRTMLELYPELIAD